MTLAADRVVETADGFTLPFEIQGDGPNWAVVLHGGPGSGRSRSAPALFDPSAWRVVSFDQRGCGGSTPNVADDSAALDRITLSSMVGDVETLRRALDVDRWVVLGASWGATLALAYAAAYRDSVSSLVLVGVTTTSAREIDWLFRGLAPLFPEPYAALREALPAALRDGPEPRGVDVVAAYRALLTSADPGRRDDALSRWRAWETAAASANGQANPRWDDPRWALARARITAHVFAHRAWLDDDALLRAAESFGDLPGAMIQGAFDVEAPRETAWRLSQAWPRAVLNIVPFAGHGVGDDAMARAVRAALKDLSR